MIVLAGAVIGAVLGGLTAKRRGGSRWDIAQYAAAYGIAFALLGVISTIVVHRWMI
jgi:uncharacterized protein YcfJ